MRRAKCVLVACVLSAAAIAQTQDDVTKCTGSDREAMIVGCTALINSGRLPARALSAVLNNRARAYNDKGEYDLALADLNEAIRLDPTNGNAFGNRGNTYNYLEKTDEAIADYAAALRLAPDAHFYAVRGTAYYKKRDYDRAIEDENNAIRLDSHFAEAFHFRGLAYFQKRDYQRAISDDSEAARLKPDYSEAFLNRSRAYYRLEQLDLAFADVEKALQLTPRFAAASAMAFYMRGLIKQKRGDKSGGDDDIARARQLLPSVDPWQ